MRDILGEIVVRKREIVAARKNELPLGEIKKNLAVGNFRLSRKAKAEDFSLIAECKLNSPAKGRLCRRYSVEELAAIYAANGASALSVHTDPHFLGKNEDIAAVRRITDLPIMRKDFIIDEYQIYEARYLGADAVLLIARILSAEELLKFLYTAWGIGLDALIEVHDEKDIDAALATPAEFIGVNNRNLKTFETSIENTLSLLPYIKAHDERGGRTLISESGVTGGKDAKRLRLAGCGGILVGEGLVVAEDVGAMAREMKAAGRAKAN